MKRVTLIVLDGVGVGALPDAAKFGDEGACTVGHVVDRAQPKLPNMMALGFGSIEGTHLTPAPDAIGAFGRAMEKSQGKDTTTGHWEMMGIKLPKAFPTYPNGFPDEVIKAFENAVGTRVLGNYAASGTAILDELGEEHLKTKCPIVYTSADSVFQIACHEELYPPQKLYEMCRIARALLQGEHAVGRVIARPFIGKPGAFVRTSARRDFSLEPTGVTLLDELVAKGFDSLAVGKIEDIFCGRGITKSDHASGNPACIEATIRFLKTGFTGLLFTNLVDYDMLYGHRNDVEGFKNALEAFDQSLPQIMEQMNADDLLLITADHGVDPTFPGTDHTREYVPILAWHPGMKTLIDLGTRATYADIAATIAENFGIANRFGASSFYELIR